LNDGALRRLIQQEGLLDPLRDMGRSIVETMVDIFADLPPDHYLFEQYSFVSAADLPVFADLLKSIERGETLKDEAVWSFVGVTFSYIEPRHRLGLLTPDLMDRIVAARRKLMAEAAASGSRAIEFYDPTRLCVSAPVRDNLLFGRIAYGSAGAEKKVFRIVRQSIQALDLEPQIYRLGLDFQAGNGGRRLSPAQRSAVAIARTLVKRPDLLVLENALVAFGEAERRAIREAIIPVMTGKTLVVIGQDAPEEALFDVIVRFQGARVASVDQTLRHALAADEADDNSDHDMQHKVADPAAAAE
jgi:putative ABC transport system ATP-binding protein